MTSQRNDITGDKLQTKPSTKEYRDGWDAIFGKAGYPEPPKELCSKCGLPTQVDDYGLCNMCYLEEEDLNDREIQESK